jgi:hypothetical protein
MTKPLSPAQESRLCNHCEGTGCQPYVRQCKECSVTGYEPVEALTLREKIDANLKSGLDWRGRTTEEVSSHHAETDLQREPVEAVSTTPNYFERGGRVYPKQSTPLPQQEDLNDYISMYANAVGDIFILKDQIKTLEIDLKFASGYSQDDPIPEEPTRFWFENQIAKLKAELTQALTSLAKYVGYNEKLLAERLRNHEELGNSGRYQMELRERAELAEASLAEAQKRIKELEKELGR